MGKTKYIDADKLKRHYAWWNDESKKIFDEFIDLQPDADVEEVVRCKDCKHRYVGGYTTQYYVCDFMDAELKDEGYCSYGERKDG